MRKEVDTRELRNNLDKLSKFRHTIKLSPDEKAEAVAHPHASSTFTQKTFNFLKRMINHTLYQSVPTLVGELRNFNGRVCTTVHASCHDFVAENFEQLETRMKELDNYYTNLY